MGAYRSAPPASGGARGAFAEGWQRFRATLLPVLTWREKVVGTWFLMALAAWALAIFGVWGLSELLRLVLGAVHS